MVPEPGKTEKTTKIFKNPKKCEFCQKKIAENCDTQKLKPIPRQLKIFNNLLLAPGTYYFSGPWDSNNMNNDNVKKYDKKLQVLSNNAKTHEGKNLKTIPLPLETICSNLSSNPLPNPRGGF